MKKLSFKVLSNRVTVTLLFISLARIHTQICLGISKPVLLNHSSLLYRKPLFVITDPFLLVTELSSCEPALRMTLRVWLSTRGLVCY